MLGWIAIIIGILVLLGICWYYRKTIKSFFKKNKKKVAAIAVAGAAIGATSSTFIIPEGYRPNTATMISNSNGKSWAATWDNVGSAINDLNSTGGWVSLPADSSITHTGVINVFNQLDVGIIIEGNGCNLVKGSSEPFFNFSGYDLYPTVLRNEPIAIRDINFDCADYDGYALIIEQKRYVSLDNLYFIDGDNGTNGEPYLFMGSRSYLGDITNCVFRDGYAGIWFYDNYGLGYGSANAGIVENCVFNNLSQYAINNTDANTLVISHGDYETCGNSTSERAAIICNDQTTITDATRFERNDEANINITSNDCSVINCQFFSISSDDSDTVGIKNYGDNTIIDNVGFLPVGKTCIELMDGDNVVIHDCTVSDEDGVITTFIDADQTVYKNITISGNTVNSSYTKVVKINSVENLKLNDNNFLNLCTGVAQAGVGIAWDGVTTNNDIIITGNTFSGGALATYCLEVARTDRALISNNVFDLYSGSADGIRVHYADNVTVSNNIFTSGIVDIIVEGTSIDNLKVWGNDGYTTESVGLAIIPTGSASLVVSHNCSVTPFTIQLTPRGNLSAAFGAATNVYWYVDTITATQFTIHVGADLTAPIGFYWRVDFN